MANLLDSASILLTPTAYDNGSILAIQPSDGSGDMTFSRGSSATRVNEQGLIEDVASNLPRIDYTDGCGSLLLEPQSTNLLPYSEDFSFWNQSGVSIISNSAISPDGTLNADKITATTVDPASFIFTNVTATEHTFSFYYKGEANSIGKEARVLFWFIGTATGTDLSVPFTVTGDWQRFESQITPTGAGTLALRIDFPADDAVVGDYGYLWGAQLEENSYASSYIPTQGAISTRLQDIATNSGNASLINSEQGTLYAEIEALTSTQVATIMISISNGSTNAIKFGYQQGANVFFVESTGTTNSIGIYSEPINPLTYSKVALSYKENDVKLYINGSLEAIDTSFTAFAPDILNTLNFDSGTSAFKFNGKIKELAVYPTTLTDAQLIELTTI
jgi:hypothetical protein